MEILFASNKIERLCTDMKAARKFFGGEEVLVRGLFSRINALRSADTIKDIIVQPPFRFHKLHNWKDGTGGDFAIDVKTRRDPWRIILQPLDQERQPFVPCNIDEIAMIVRIVEIEEVSKHYE